MGKNHRLVDTCPKCKEVKPMTRHHIKPVRHFGRGKQNSEIFLLCRECHNQLETLIPFEVMKLEFYYYIIIVFLLIGKPTEKGKENGYQILPRSQLQLLQTAHLSR